ncbi:hypothetical protein LWP59_16770 [Amycolatopsis acidiphila]|uniref:HEAT repeat domain-containing protein n=1 Tax=Amycolatopsis acidiphila TaxID=715473 RepID=A0A558AB38_9PSEU|nr:hypothetical protein [Amycolatopsis acidiphila]TVT21478.1 hypothetical protein FNH06_17045 [Amycolatopsis acidiphila]UIJ63160.1 hypothetical protein LWP59_16770 [Amycolatopsis acidiphila]GHG74134.1 hypothetical protein GCM10017788_37760 [Amycolatopsis acidiphila]
MTTHDETPREIEELERFVQAGVEKLSGTHYLDEAGARELVEEIASRRAFVSRSLSMVELAAAYPRFAWPAELSEADRRQAVVQMIDSSGIAIADHNDFTFARPDVEAYLAAGHIVRSHPRGPRRWDPRTWKYLAPQPTWPWPHIELSLFLAALWWPAARTAVERQLGRLLSERHRNPNVRFVIELVRRDLLPGSDVGRQTTELLRHALADDRLADQDWMNTAVWLHQIDPKAAVAELDDFIRVPLQAISDQRKLLATVELMKHAPDRGRKNLEILAANLTGTPRDRLKTARLIGDIDPAPGIRAMLQLASTPDMHEFRADAAIAAGSPDLLADLVEHGHGLSDDTRLRLSTELLGRDRVTGIAAAERFAVAATPKTRLRIAELLRSYDPQKAVQITSAVARTADHRGDGELRLRAVILIGEIDPAQAIPALTRLSADSSVSDEVRFDAAKHIAAEHQGPITALVELVGAPDVDWTYRAAAAKEAGKTDPVTGARLLIATANTGPPSDAARLDLLKKAHALDPGTAAEQLVELAGRKRVAGRIRLEAGNLAGPKLSKPRRIALYSDIATSTNDDNTAREAAQKVLATDPVRGRQLMAVLADRKKASFTYRLTAAKEGGSEAIRPLRDLAGTARPDAIRLEAAQTLLKFDRTSARSALKRLVQSGQPGKVRIEAALSLPRTSAVHALITITGDRRENDSVRLQAALKAKEYDAKRGRQALHDLIEDPRLSRRVQEQARRHLKK